jgi:hypothetical protein
MTTRSELITTPGAFSWNVPAGVSRVRVSLWGGGAAGFGMPTNFATGGAGGGSGEWVSNMEVVVTPGGTLTGSVGAAGVGGAGIGSGHGGDTTCGNLVARGGRATLTGAGNAQVGGQGGGQTGGLGSNNANNPVQGSTGSRISVHWNGGSGGGGGGSTGGTAASRGGTGGAAHGFAGPDAIGGLWSATNSAGGGGGGASSFWGAGGAGAKGYDGAQHNGTSAASTSYGAGGGGGGGTFSGAGTTTGGDGCAGAVLIGWEEA